MTRIVIILLSLFCLGISSDVGVTKIFRPSGIIPPDNYIPRVQLKNNEGTSENFWVFFTIRVYAGSVVYLDSVYENLTGNETKNVYFSPWNATLGLYTSQCSLYLATDINPANDTLSSNVKVENLVPGEWVMYDSVPSGLSGKKVKDGGGLADGSTRGEKLIYVLKGNKTPEFYLYDVIFKTWETKSSVPTSPENPTKHPKKGACMYREGDYIYLIRGNNTFEFWAYYIPDDSWTRLKDVPQGISGKKPKDGTSLAKGRVSNQTYLFLTKGKTQEFYAYDMDMDTWIEKSPAPFYISESKSRLKHGSCLVDDGENIYLLKDKFNLLYFYDCDMDSWYRRESLPHYGIQQKKKKVKKGGAMYYKKGNPDIIYALKGGCHEFWCYDVDGDSWIELPSIPSEIYRKKVKGGASLMMTSGCVFALKGGNTRELWRYVPIDTLFATNNMITSPIKARDNQQAKSTLLRYNQLRDLPNENLIIFDAVGRKINLTSKQNIMQRLKPGIYFLSKYNEKGYDFRKVVILR